MTKYKREKSEQEFKENTTTKRRSILKHVHILGFGIHQRTLKSLNLMKNGMCI